MFDDVEATMKIYVGLAGAFLAAAIGSFARNVYADGGFKWRRWIWDLPFAMTCALVVGGVGDLMNVTPIVVTAGAGAVGFLGPQWLENWLRARAEKREQRKGGKDGDPKNP